MALRAFIAASFLVVAGLCRAQGTAFSGGELASDGQGQALYRVNLGSLTATRLGYVKAPSNVPVTSLGGLTFGLDGQLYALGALNGAPQTTLLTLSQSVASATVVSQVNGVPSQASSGLSLSFGCDGRLWMASADSNNFWELTPGTGATRPVGNLGVKVTALTTRGNVLYGIGGSGNANLYSIDTNTGHATLIGPYNTSAANPVDAGFDASGTLWGLIRNFNNNDLPTQLNALVQISPTSGGMSAVGSIANPGQSGLTFPVPLSGLAVAPPVCSVTPPPVAVGAPTLSPIGVGIFLLSLIATVGFAFSRRRWN